MVSEKAHASSRIFYGWYVMAAGFLLLFFQSGARYSFGIMFKPMMAELGWNRASISSVFFLNAENRADSDASPNSIHSDKDLNLKQAMKTYSFWLFLVSMFICGGGDFLIIIHLVPFVTDYGVAPTSAANMLDLYGRITL